MLRGERPTLFHHRVLQWNSSHPYRLPVQPPNETLHLCHQSAILRSIERRTFAAPVCIMCLLDFWHRAPLFQLWEAGEPLQRLHQEVIFRLSFSWIFFFFSRRLKIFLFPFVSVSLQTGRPMHFYVYLYIIFFWVSFDHNVFSRLQHPPSPAATPFL